MTDLSPILPKLAKLVPRLASDADAEIVSSVRAIDRVLRGAGFDWHDLTSALGPVLSARHSVRQQHRSQPQPSQPSTWLEIAEWCAFCPQAGTLKPKEMEFVLNMVGILRRFGVPKEKQAKWLRSIYEQLGGPQ